MRIVDNYNSLHRKGGNPTIMDMSLGTRLKLARTHAGLTQRALAECAKIEQPLISQIERDKVHKTAYIVALASSCGVDPTWLAEGQDHLIVFSDGSSEIFNLDKPVRPSFSSENTSHKGEPVHRFDFDEGISPDSKIRSYYEVKPAKSDTSGGIQRDITVQPEPSVKPERAAMIPVVGKALLGDDGYFDEMDYPAGHGDGYLDVQSRDQNAYGLRVQGSSMMPRIRSGEFVLIEPNHSYSSGDEVLVKTVDGRAMIKEFIYLRDGHYRFDSVNADHPPIIIEKSQVEKIHYVAAILKSSRMAPSGLDLFL